MVRVAVTHLKKPGRQIVKDADDKGAVGLTRRLLIGGAIGAFLGAAIGFLTGLTAREVGAGAVVGWVLGEIIGISVV